MPLNGDPVIFDDTIMSPMGTSNYVGPVELEQSGTSYAFLNAETGNAISGAPNEPTFTVSGVGPVAAPALGFVEIPDSQGGAIYDLAGNYIGQQGGEAIGGTETVTQFINAMEADYQSNGPAGAVANWSTIYATAEGSTPEQTGAFNSSGLLSYTADTGGTGSVTQTGGATTLTQLTDVTLTNPTNGQFLEFNGTQWVNASLPQGLTINNVEQVIAADLGHAFQSMGVYGSQTPEVIAALGHYL